MPDNNASQYVEMAMQAKSRGNPEQALSFFEQAARHGLENAELHYLIGDTFHDVGKLDHAISHLRKARNLDPQHIGAVYTLAVALQDKGELSEAIECYKVVERLRPNHPKTYNNMGSAYLRVNNSSQAIICFEKALRLDPTFFMAHYNLGTAYYQTKNLAAAKQSFQQAIALKPDFPQAHNNLANLFKDNDELKLAAVEYRLAIQYNPNLAEAYFNLANVLIKTWHIDEALSLLEKLLAIDPKHEIGRSNYLFYAHYSDRFNADDFYAMALKWGEIHASALEESAKKNRFINRVHSERKLKIGYVSGDFCLHPVGSFIEGVFTEHDKSKVEIYCYYNFVQRDTLTTRLASLVDHWRDIHDVTDEQADALIRNDAIDILVDLSGHTEANRLLLFARKPAPVQVTWLGYCGTTGLQSMDYLLADAKVIPPEAAKQYSEEIWYLPESYINYAPDKKASLSVAPANRSAIFTFGCFNNLAKITKGMIALWSQILHSVENSQILIRGTRFKDAEVAERFVSAFVQHGIDADRVKLEHDVLPHQEFLQRYNDVDVVLDTFPYNGVTTTCDASWMGVPVVTLMGEGFISRNSASILTSLGLPELIATTQQQYVDIAIALAREPRKLAELKQCLRRRFEESVLGNSRRFTRNLEDAYHGMWAEVASDIRTVL